MASQNVQDMWWQTPGSQAGFFVTSGNSSAKRYPEPLRHVCGSPLLTVKVWCVYVSQDGPSPFSTWRIDKLRMEVRSEIPELSSQENWNWA